jgi:nucleoside-diphosphate-sugar epimerase
MPLRYFLTGATGFVGSHIAEACVEHNQPVTALVRPGSDTTLLTQLGVTLLRGDFNDGSVLRRAVEEADVVVNCGAKVGDWGPVEDYRAVNVEGLRRLLDACKGQALERFIHVGSLGVYAARHHYGTTEEEPLPARHSDGYTQSKTEADLLAQSYHRDFGVPVVVLRPGFVYGPRDRVVLPRLVENLRSGRLRYLGGKGRRALNTIFIRNLVDAVFLAVEKPQAVGQVYNLTDGEFVSKRRFIEAIAEPLGLPRPTRSLPLWFGKLIARYLEWRARRKGAVKAPVLTQARVKFLGLNLDFSIEKARRELGYQPRVDFDQGMYETMRWYKQTLTQEESFSREPRASAGPRSPEARG